MGYKMKPLPDGTTMQDLLNHTQSRAYRQLSRIFYSGAAVSTKDLVGMTNVSISSIWVAVKAMKDAGLIYIVRWEKPQNGGTTTLAVYKMGNMKDAPKPAPLPHTQKRQAYKEQTPLEKAPPDVTVWHELANALVPKRTPEEIWEVNWRYLCWLNPEGYQLARKQ